MIEIRPAKITDAEITVPGSKSYTHRMLILSALSDGLCVLDNALQSEDTLLTCSALKQMGISAESDSDRFVVHGRGGKFYPCKEPIFLGNSGTSMRLLTAVAALGEGRYELTGNRRMGERPIQPLIDALNQLGVAAKSIHGNGCPPVEIFGKKLAGGKVSLNCEKSSQYLSALLLIAPYTEHGIEVSVSHGPVSKPYIDMTLRSMEGFGVRHTRETYDVFSVPGGQRYRAGHYEVEPDASQAGYFWAAAAVSGGSVRVRGIGRESIQGDVRLTSLLEKMGCRVQYDPGGIRVTGGPLTAIEADMADLPDMVPTLAVVAAFARGTTLIKNVAHLAAKESDRLAAVSEQLKKMGIHIERTDTGLKVTGGTAKGTRIETYGDHRIAMSFALAGLRIPGVVIEDERCVEKSFPQFWQVFGTLYHP